MADFCVWPDAAVREALRGQFPPAISEPALQYYLNCSRPQRPSPWTAQLRDGENGAQELLKRVKEVYEVALKYYPSQQVGLVGEGRGVMVVGQCVKLHS